MNKFTAWDRVRSTRPLTEYYIFNHGSEDEILVASGTHGTVLRQLKSVANVFDVKFVTLKYPIAIMGDDIEYIP